MIKRSILIRSEVAWLLLRLLVFLGALGLLSGRLDEGSFDFVRISGLDLRYLGPMLITSCILLVLFAKRWFVVATALGLAVRFPRFIRAIWLAQALGELGPPLLVGETVRFASLSDLADRKQLIASQGVDRLSGYLPLIGFAIFDLALLWVFFDFDATIDPGRLFLMLGAIGLVLAFCLRFVRINISGVFKSGFSLLSWRSGLEHYALSTLIQLGLMLNMVLAALCVGVEGGWWKVLMCAPLILFLTSFIPGFFSDWGKREAVSVYLLGMTGISGPQALWTSLIFGLSHTVVALPGLFFLLRPSTRKPV